MRKLFSILGALLLCTSLWAGKVTITYSTANLPASYGDNTDFTQFTLEGYKFQTKQIYKNGTKIQWKASVGAMYNDEVFPGKLTSVAITWDASDSKKNHTLLIGHAANPTDGTAITGTLADGVTTFLCGDSCEYFVLTNGVNAGYITKLEITYEDPTAYFVNKDGWSPVKAYVWYNDGSDHPYKDWSGEAMTTTGDKKFGFDVYKYQFPATYNKVIFNDGGSNQTGDLDFDVAKPYYFDGTWYASLAAIPSKTVYFVNAASWDPVKAHVWYKEGSTDIPYKTWPGENMTKTGDKKFGFDIYSYEFPTKFTNLLFTKDGTDKTDDFAYDATKTYYFNGVWYASLDAIPSNKVYFVNVPEWAEVAAYGWAGAEYHPWPGDLMTATGDKKNGYDVYSFEFPAGYNGMIFNNNKAGDSPEKQQTGDLTFDGTNAYFYDGAWFASLAAIPSLYTAYFVNDDAWDDVYAYVWYKEGSTDKEKVAWPGEAATKTGDKKNGYDVYSYSFWDTYTSIIFNNKDNGKQTPDKVFDSSNPYYYKGTWYASLDAVPATCAVINALEDGVAATLGKGAVVTFANKAYAYIKDETGVALIYKNNFGLATGDTILIDIPGKGKIYNNLPEFVPTAASIAATDKKAGVKPDYPDAVAVPSASNVNQVVVYDDVEFDEDIKLTAVTTFEGKWNSTKVQFRNMWKAAMQFDKDKKYRIVAANNRDNKDDKGEFRALITEADAKCQDGPYGLQVNDVSDTLKYIYDEGLEGDGYKQYGINNKAIAKGDKIVIENLSCNSTWLPTIEDVGAKANFDIVNDTLIAKAAGTFNFYLKQKPFADKLAITYTPVEKWYIVGDFTNWFVNKAELEATEKADSLAKVIKVESDTLAHFLLVRIKEEGPAKDTAYYGTHLYDGKLEVMQYGKSSGFWFYADNEKFDVPFQPTNAGEDYTFCVNLKHQDGDKHAPLVSIIIPEEKAIEKTFKVKVPAGTEKVYMGADWDSAVDGWEFEEMEADGENQFKLTASVLKAFKYKYCSAADWEHVEVAADRKDIAERTYGDTTDVVALFKNPKWSNIYLWRKSNGYAGEELLMEDPTKPELLSVPVNYTAAMLDSFLIVDTRGDIKYYKIANDAEDMSRANCIQWTLVENDARNVAINIDQAGGYIFVWEPDDHKISVLYPAEPKIDITFQVKVPEGTENCYIAGDWEGDGTWTFKQMDKVDAIDHDFELKVEDIVATVPYKYSAAADWEHGEVKADRSEVDNRTYAGGIDEVALFKDPAWTNIFLHNDFNAGWNDVEFVATEDPNVFKATLDITEAKIAELMINDNGTWYKHDDSKPDYLRANSGEWWQLEEAADGKKGVYLDADVTGVYTFLWATDTKNINITFPAEPKVDITFKVKAPEGTVDCYIAGDWAGDGNWTFKQMGVVDAIDHQFELKVEDIVATVPYKYSAAADWEHVEVNADRSLIADNRTYKGGIDEVALFKDPAWTNVFLHNDFNAGWNDVEFVATDEATVLKATLEITEAKIAELMINDNGTWYKHDDSKPDYLRANSGEWWQLEEAADGKKGVYLDADVKGVYTFLWATDTKNINITFPKATGCENVYGTDVELRKVIENGVLYIYRDGKVYNVQGQLVK